MKIVNSQGWTEAIIDENCSIEKFHKISGILQTTLNISFRNKISDIDSKYWDFRYNQKELTLHYNVYIGITIFPKSLKNASTAENKVVEDLSKILSKFLEKINNPGNFVSKYFEPEPVQWGLRGDKPLWRDMKLKTSEINIPISSNAFEKLLYKLFRELTGEIPQRGRHIHLKKYETIGMSNGVVCCDFWLEKGFSLLIQRYIESEQR